MKVVGELKGKAVKQISDSHIHHLLRMLSNTSNGHLSPLTHFLIWFIFRIRGPHAATFKRPLYSITSWI